MVDVAVVGSGPSGLILARRLARTKASFQIYEGQPDLGGTWNSDAPGSPIYESAHFISSKTLSGFPGFPMPDDLPHYPNHRQVLYPTAVNTPMLEGEARLGSAFNFLSRVLTVEKWQMSTSGLSTSCNWRSTSPTTKASPPARRCGRPA